MNIDSKEKRPLLATDWLIVSLYLALIVFGWLSVCGASYDYGNMDFFSFDSRAGKQLVWIGCSFILGFILMMLDSKIYDTVSYLVYIIMMLLLLVTPFLAKDIKGSMSWISLGPVNVQPAEFAKCATALALSKYMGAFGFSISHRREALTAVGMLLLPMFLIVMQKETGSALVYLSLFLVFYREGMPGSILFTGIAAVVYFVVGSRFGAIPMPGTLSSIGEFAVLTLIYIFTYGMLKVYTPHNYKLRRKLQWGVPVVAVAMCISAFIKPFDAGWVMLGVCLTMAVYVGVQTFALRVNRYLFVSAFTLGSLAFFYSSDYVLNNILEPHQQIRVRVLLGLEDDPKGAGYNVNQSMIAIGSGGIMGKGFLNGTQTKLKYVPEQDTDFIFCTVGEEEGFVGSAVALTLFLCLILRIIYRAERQSLAFGRIYGYCVASILFFHVFINVGMVLGLTPVIGIPLPFFSYGGSSLWGFTLLLFIFLRIDAGGKAKAMYSKF